MRWFKKRVSLKDVVLGLEEEVAELRAERASGEFRASLTKLEEYEQWHELNKRIKKIEDSVPQTATCHICGKRDFMDNLADVGWMDEGANGKIPYQGEDTSQMSASATMMIYTWPKFAHPECAKIRKSDDGKGWVRVKK